MRHPNADNIRKTCRRHLDDILDALGRPASGPIETNRDGWVNVCFLTEDAVIRFNARDPHLPKFRREEACYRRLHEAGFPVPAVLARFDAGRFGYPVLVTERLPGENLEQTWSTLTPGQRETLACDAGRWLARLHDTMFERFGEPFAPSFPSWGDYLRDVSGRFLDDCDQLGIFTTGQLDRFRRALQTAVSRLPTLNRPRLVHRDFHFGNLLHDGEAITGILDFEWSMAGDPAWDLTRVNSMDDTWPGSSTDFRAGYESETAWPAATGVRFPLYQCIQNLELCAVARRFLSDQEAEDYRNVSLRQLERFVSTLR